MLRIRELIVRSFEIDYLDIYWTVDSSYGESVLDYEFFLEKSGAQFGPFNTVTSGMTDVYHIRDNTVRASGSLFNANWYRIRVRNKETSEESLYPDTGEGIRLSAPPDLHALEIARHNRQRLESGNGRHVWVFPTRIFGQKCSCYDKVTGRRTRSKCISCYDTGVAGGFHTPLRVRANITSNGVQQINGPNGPMSIEQGFIQLANYPEIQPSWVIIETENRRWKVGAAVTYTRVGRALVKQSAQLTMIPPGDIEYSIPMNIVSPELLVTNPVGNTINRTSI